MNQLSRQAAAAATNFTPANITPAENSFVYFIQRHSAVITK